MGSIVTQATMHSNKKGTLHGPGAHIYDEADTVCESGQYSCGADLMPPGPIA
jgi:hypothetical protein